MSIPDESSPEPRESLPESTPLSPRRHFAAGDYVTRFGEEAPIPIVLDTPFEKPGWKQRIPSTFGKAPYPGTAILFDGHYYEVVRIKWKEGTFPRFQYYLAPWKPEFPIREQVDYTQAYARTVLAERKKAAAHNKRAGLLQFSMPLLGLLPADDQRRIDRIYGLPALRMTFYSTLPLMPLGTWLSMAWVEAAISGAPPPGLYGKLLSWGPYIFIESYIRLTATWKFGLPMGSLAIVLPIEIVREIRRQFDPEYRRKAFESMKVGRSRHEQFRNATDEVLEVFGQEYDLEVVSILPKPHWSPQTGVHYRDTWYVPVDSRIVRDPKLTRYRFLLKKAPEEMVFRTTCDYVPEEVREFFRQKRLRDLGHWVEIFAPFCGLVEGDDQKRLAELYNYDPEKFTRWTTVAVGIGSVFAAMASVVNFTTGIAGPLDLVFLLLALFLLLESKARWTLVSKGEPSGSLLRIFVRPFLWRFLE